MTSLSETSGVEYSQQDVEEVRKMPLRKCPYCKGLSNFDIGNSLKDLPGRLISLDMCQNCGRHSYFETKENDRKVVLDVYPKLDINVDEELPTEIKVAFQEAAEALNSGIWNSCVVMCRRALQEAMTDLGAEGKDLFHQIDDLEVKRKITPELKEWAHEGRVGGKLGAHGIGEKKWADKNDAEEVFEFCRWFLRYVYVLPTQLQLRRKTFAEESVPTET